MIFGNPYVVIQVILMVIALMWAQYMDGAEMPPRKYNFMQTFWSVAISFALLMGAVSWAASH